MTYSLFFALLGAVLLYDLVKQLVARARPPARFDVGYRFSGFAFPSGHATQGLAVWGMLALLTAGAMPKRRYVPFVVALLIVLLVGTSRIYLGAHWLSDVLGGYALGGLWLSLLVTAMLVRSRSSSREIGISEVVERAS